MFGFNSRHKMIREDRHKTYEKWFHLSDYIELSINLINHFNEIILKFVFNVIITTVFQSNVNK